MSRSTWTEHSPPPGPDRPPRSGTAGRCGGGRGIYRPRLAVLLRRRGLATSRKAYVRCVGRQPPESGRLKLGLPTCRSPRGWGAEARRSVSLREDPAIQGSWQVLPFHSGVLAIHAATLPWGKVLFFAGSGN